MFLGSRRRDRNQERHNVLLQIEGELAGYGLFSWSWKVLVGMC